VLRSTLLYFSLLIFVIMLYGKGLAHTGYIIFRYWLSVCHISLYFPSGYFPDSVFYSSNVLLMWTAVLYIPHSIITQNDIKHFKRLLFGVLSGLKHAAVFQGKWTVVLDGKSAYLLFPRMQLALHCWELHIILFRIQVFLDVMLCQWVNGSQHF
jgi:hypothetical protein